MSKNSKENATVILAGEGADELFAGYDTNVKAHLLHNWKSKIPGFLGNLLPTFAVSQRFKEIGKKFNLSDEEFIRSFFITYPEETISDIVQYDLGSVDGNVSDKELGIDGIKGSFLDKYLAFQMKTYLIALLMKQDKMSMAASIETRVPFLDHKVVEFACALPDFARVSEKKGKFVLKKMCESILP